MIEDNIISLCVVGRKNDKPAFYRVADYNTESNSFEAVDISEQKIKYVYSKNSYISRIDEKYPIGEVVLREWEYELSENGTVYRGNEHYSDDVEKNKDLLILSEEDILYTWKYLDEPASPCSAAFWEESILSPGLNPFEKNSYNADLLAIPSALEDENLIKAYLEFMTHEDCKNVIREYLAEKQRIGQQLATQEHIFYQKYDEVAPENILQTILDKYKGKAVLIDIWATWCGPCRAGHKAMAPMKEEMKGQNVQFVYLTSPTSPLKTWQEMLNDIDGDHYYLTEEQYHYILDKYESKGIPTYAIYNTKGEQTYKNIGFPGNDVIRKELEAASK